MTKKMIIMTMTKAPTENKEVIIVLCDISLLALSSKVKVKSEKKSDTLKTKANIYKP